MINKILLRLQRLISALLDNGLEDTDRQKVTVVGSGNNITIINGNKSLPNSMLLNNQNKVKQFPRKNCKGPKRYQKYLDSSKRGRRS